MFLRSFAILIATLFVQMAAGAHLTAQQNRNSSFSNTSIELQQGPSIQLANRDAALYRAEAGNSSSEAASVPIASGAADGHIGGTVMDSNGDLVPRVTLVLDGNQTGDHREIVADENATFQFDGLKANIPYRVSIRTKGFTNWQSAPITLTPGQFLFLTDIHIKIQGDNTSVTVYATPAQIATEQVKVQEQQRVLGFIPNFYVVYDSKNAVPLTAKLKYKLAFRTMVDPVTIGGVAMMAGVYQASDNLDYVQGAKGYGQRFGAVAADGASDILIGGAVLPALLRQDPRYFYQGSGTTKSRVMHAILSPFICRGDNGQLQPNYSTIGGDLASSALSNAYYPQSNRGAGLVFSSFALGTAERMMSDFGQEFIFPRFTTKGKR